MLTVKVALQWSPSHHSCTRRNRPLLVLVSGHQYLTQGHTCLIVLIPAHSCSTLLLLHVFFLMEAGHRVELLSAPLFTQEFTLVFVASLKEIE